MTQAIGTPAVLRPSDTGAKVLSEELFFDLVYVFAVTQLSHYLLGHLSLLGALHTLVLWFAVWLGWQYTAWITNWFNPAALPIRLLLFAIMLVALVMGAVLPQAFGDSSLIFAGCFALIQVGRTIWVSVLLGRGHVLAPNFHRMLAWNCVAATLWIVGAFAGEGLRLALWFAAVLCEYLSPMNGFAFPGLGRSKTSDWTIDGAHLAERCQLFVIVALGESILASGVALAHHTEWHAVDLYAFLVGFTGSLALWWLYFDTSSDAAAHVIEHSDDPGRIGAKFHYTHVILIAGIIVSAVADELVIGEGGHHAELKTIGVLVGGAAIYLLGNALFKRVVFGFVPQSHLIGLAALAALALVGSLTSVLVLGSLVTAVLIGVAAMESAWRRRR